MRVLFAHIWLLGLGLIFSIGIRSQTFNERYDVQGQNLEEVAFSVESFEGGTVVAVSSLDAESGNELSLLSISDNGTLLSAKHYSVEGFQYWAGFNNSSGPTLDGNFVIGFNRSNSDSSSVMVMKYTFSGDSLWTRTLQNLSAASEIGWSVKSCQDGGFIVAGLSDTGESEDSRGLLIKLDSNGIEEWRIQDGDGIDRVSFVQVDEMVGVGYFVGGSIRYEVSGISDLRIMHYNYLGEEVWNYVHDNEFADSPAQVLVGNGKIYFAGMQAVNNGDSGNPILGCLDVDGNLEWTNVTNPAAVTNAHFAMELCENGDIITAGSKYIPELSLGGLLCRYSEGGDSIWCREYQNIEDSYCFLRGVVQNENGGFTACGMTRAEDKLELSQDTWVIQVDSLGCLIPGCSVGVFENIQREEMGFDMWPNPVLTNLNISLPFEAHKVAVYDVHGKLCSHEEVNRSKENISISVLSLRPGVYALKITSQPGEERVRKFIKCGF